MIFQALYLYLDKMLYLAVTAPSCRVPEKQFLIFPPWWEYMTSFKLDTLGQCVPDPRFPDSILPISLAVLDMLLRLGGFVAVAMVILSGIQYILAQGNSEKSASARRTLYNALIGLGIAFTATLIVAFAGNYLAR